MRDKISGHPKTLGNSQSNPRLMSEAILEQPAPTSMPVDLRYMSEPSQDQPSLAEVSRTSQLALDLETNKLLLVV